MKRLVYIVLLITILPIYPTFAINSYKVTVDVIELNSTSNTLKANLTYEVIVSDTLSSNCYIPLAFSYQPELNFIIDPTSDYLTILYGFLLPAKNNGLCNIIYHAGDFSVKFIFKNVSFNLNESIESNNLKVFIYQASQAEKIIRETIKSNNIVELKEVVIKSNNFQYSIPQENPSNGSSYHTIPATNKEDIKVYFKPSEKQMFLYIFLGILGLLIGIGAAPRLVKSTRSAIFWLIISILGGLILAFVFFNLISPAQRINDTTTIVTIGTVAGIIIGLIFRSTIYLIPSKNSKPKAGEGGKEEGEKTPANKGYT
jgi:hypothetical protein